MSALSSRTGRLRSRTGQGVKAAEVIRRLGAFRLGRSGAAELVALALFGLFLAAIGPFGSDKTPTASRYLYWQLAMIGGA